MLVCKLRVCVLYVFVCCCASAGDVNRNVRPSNRIQIRNVPAAVTKDAIDQLVGTYGTVKKSHLGTHTSFMLALLVITFKHSPVKLLHDWLIWGAVLRLSFSVCLILYTVCRMHLLSLKRIAL